MDYKPIQILFQGGHMGGDVKFSVFLVFMMALPFFIFAVDHNEQNDYRRFDETTPEHVKSFYRLNHTYQTLDFVLAKKEQYLPLRRQQMGIWEAVRLMDTIVDESDPDLSLPQSYHAYQTAEAFRRDGYPRWLILAGFIHDLGKILTFYGEPQWAVVGDTFPVGCAFSDKVVFPEFFALNADEQQERYQTPEGIYTRACGLDNLHMSWGHDEYLYHVTKDYLPEPAAYVIRYHSFYAAHREGAYRHLMSAKDTEMMKWLKLFSDYDLYSKSDQPLDVESLRPYYEDLVAEFFPPQIQW
jgi:inositol oxygenase